MSDALSRAKDCVRRATLASLEGNLSVALSDLIAASELYAQAVKETRNKDERKHIIELFDVCAQEAECVKARQKVKRSDSLQRSLDNLQIHDEHAGHVHSMRSHTDSQEIRPLSKKEQVLLLKSSSINDLVCPIWNDESIASHMNVTEPYEDSVRALAGFDNVVTGYVRASICLPDHSMDDIDLKLYPSLAQRVINDCSLVASLIVASQWSFRQHTRLITKHLHPQDADGYSTLSPAGKYMMKICLNGTYRQIVVDDLLPLDSNGSPTAILAFSEQYPAILWPAVVEKVFLKVVGGDFQGSCSATDLRLLTGWIPQEIFLRTEGLDVLELSRILFQPWLQGGLLITIGSGKLSLEEQADTGIISEHNYAVIGLREESNEFILTIQNPWRPILNDHDTSAAKRRTTFDMDIVQVRHHFHQLFLNWHPRRWQFKATVHTTLTTDQFSITDHNVHSCPQYTIANNSETATVIYLLLERHRPLAPSSSSIAIFDSSQRIVTSNAPLQRTDFYGSLHSSIEFIIPALTTRTIVLMRKGKPDLPASYATLTAYCHTSSVHFEPLPASKLHDQKFNDTWPSNGGSLTSTQFAMNPRYLLTVAAASSNVTIILETEDRVACHFSLVYGHAQVLQLTHQNTRHTQSHYKTQYTSAKIDLAKGEYTLVCSAQKPPGQASLATYRLSVVSDTGIDVIKAPSLGAGKVRNMLTSHWSSCPSIQKFALSSSRMNVLTIHIHAPRSARFQVVITKDGTIEQSAAAQGCVALEKVVISNKGKYMLTSRLDSGIAEGEFEVQVYSDALLQLSRC